MRDDELVERLRAIGCADVATLTDERIRAIERRVVGAVRQGHAEPRRHVLAFVAAAVLLIALLGTVVLAAGRDRGGLTVAAADGVVVVAPSGDARAVGAGDRLADGSVVVIEPGGELEAGSAVHGPGRYVVDGDALRRVGEPAPTTALATIASTAPATLPVAVPPTRAPVTTRAPITTTTAVVAAPPPTSTTTVPARPTVATSPATRAERTTPTSTTPPTSAGELPETARPARTTTTTTTMTTTTTPTIEPTRTTTTTSAPARRP